MNSAYLDRLGRTTSLARGARRWLALLAAWLVCGVVTPRAADAGGTFFGRVPDPAKCRHYYVAAEPVLWDFCPGSRVELCGEPLPAPAPAIDFTAAKLRYRSYTDATFTTLVRETPSLGILGPVLRGVTGEFLVVHFLNRTNQPLSMHPHGVRYDKDSEGARCLSASGRGAEVPAGGTFTYVWQLDESAGPLPGEPSSKAWLYHSHVSGDDEINLGLVGAIIVTEPKRARPDGTPADVQREFATLFLLFDESGLGAEEREAYEYVDNGSGIPMRSWADTQELLERGTRAAINGRVFGTLPGLTMNEGERVRWYLFALGSERDFHTAHWHGMRVIEEGRRRTDVVELMPASMKTADAVADSPGEWIFHCHVGDHFREGMYARMTVFSKDAPGADDSPKAAFLGLHDGADTLRILRRERASDGRATLVGEVTVPEPLAVHRADFRVKLGARTIPLRVTPEGVGRGDGVEFRALNARAGTVFGGLLRFSVTLPAPAAGIAAPQVFGLGIDGALHETTLAGP